MIEPDVDLYGKLARGSALADYLEILALSGKKCSRAQLSDGVSDRFGNRKRVHMVMESADLNDEGEYDDEDLELQSHVEEAFVCLDERVDVLGDRYPFVIEPTGLRLKDDVDPEADVYIALLCITAAHAYGLKFPFSVEETFERVVALTLEKRDLLVANIGEISRTTTGQVNFPETLKGAGAALGVPTILGGGNWQRHANDMGADAIAHFPWHDKRVGRWLLVCQITCGESDSWRMKLGQAAPGLWAGWFGEKIDPICGLAVPHHVPPKTLDMLVQEQRKILLDRLRLVLSRHNLTPEEVTIIKSVMTMEILNVAAA